MRQSLEERNAPCTPTVASACLSRLQNPYTCKCTKYICKQLNTNTVIRLKVYKKSGKKTPHAFWIGDIVLALRLIHQLEKTAFVRWPVKVKVEPRCCWQANKKPCYFYTSHRRQSLGQWNSRLCTGYSGTKPLYTVLASVQNTYQYI